jgi:hypothetical protein
MSSTEAGPDQGSTPASTNAEGTLKAWKVKIPRTYAEAMKSDFKDKWHEAMTVQLGKLQDAKAYEIVSKPPPGSTVLPGKWVFDLKINKDNEVQEFRARWVICGNRQRPGYDFDESYAPVARGETMRLFLSMVAVNKMIIEQVDYTAAYLNAMIDNRVIFMKQPTGFETKGPKGETPNKDEVCLLLQALYGLRQAGHLWYETLANALRKMGFQPLPDEPCIWIYGEKQIWILLLDPWRKADLDPAIRG